MVEDWRVSLVIHQPPTARKPVSAGAVRGLLRSRVGDEISVSAGRKGIFLYAATADAAGTAERTAHEALAEQGLGADTRLERWDLSRHAWVDVRAEPVGDAAAPESPAAPERDHGRGRARLAGALIATVIEAVGAAWPPT
jgi:hypothetical protein